MNTVRSALPLVFITGALLSGSAWTGQQSVTDDGVRNDFSNATLNDRYGFHSVAHRKNFPFAISGFYQFDGNGHMFGRDVVSDTAPPPIVLHREYEGTYQVNPDGTGTLTLDLAPNFQPTGHFTIVEGGEAIEIVFAVVGNANAFTLRKQNTD